MNLHSFKAPFERRRPCLTFSWPWRVRTPVWPARSASLIWSWETCSSKAKGGTDRCTARRRSNASWSLQATEMRFKWCSTRWFVISLIKFAGDPLPTAIYIWRSNGVFHKWTQELYSIKGPPTHCGVSQTVDLQPSTDTQKRTKLVHCSWQLLPICL